jgi:hypothetical protein
MGSLWSLSLVAITLSLCRLTAATLSPRVLNSPLPYFPAWLHSRLLPTLFGAMQPLSPPCSMHEAPGKGGRSQPAFNLRALCAFLGLAHHHPPPSSLAVLTLSFTTGHHRNGRPHFLPPQSFPRQLPTTVVLPRSSPLLIQHNSISSPSLTPL